MASEPRLESRLEPFFRHRVRQVGGYTIKLAPTERGIPDRLAIFPGGRIYFVELKTTRERSELSPIQRHWHARLADRGVNVVVLSGAAEIIAWIAEVVDSLGPGEGDSEPWPG